MPGDRDTDMGGSNASFPVTRASLIADIAQGDAATRDRAFGALIDAYWRPAYKLLRTRRGRSNEDAKDLVQAFFARAMEKDFFASFDPKKARFRTFLRVCLEGFVSNEDKARSAQKRGGGRVFEGLDFDAAEAELGRSASVAADDEYFRAEWVRSVFASALGDLAAHCADRGHPENHLLFLRYDVDPGDGGPRPHYDELGRPFGLHETTVTNRLFAARRDFRRFVLERVKACTASDEEYRDEVRGILGIDPP